MEQPVVHFEIIGADPESLRAYNVEAALQRAEQLDGTRGLGLSCCSSTYRSSDTRP